MHRLSTEYAHLHLSTNAVHHRLEGCEYCIELTHLLFERDQAVKVREVLPKSLLFCRHSCIQVSQEWAEPTG